MNKLLLLKKQLILIVLLFCCSATFAQETDNSFFTEGYSPSENPTIIIQPTNYFLSPAVRDLPTCDDLCTFDGLIVPKDGANTSNDLSPKRKRKLAALNAAGRSSTSIDPKLQYGIASDNSNTNRAPIISFDDLTNTSSPPDPSMAVGPNHVVTMQNGQWAVYDKLGNIAPGFPRPLNDPLQAGGSVENAGDPVVMYDREADRWFISQFQLPSGNAFLVGISTTPDPTGAYNVYEYQLAAGNDYPHYGVWGDSYAVAGNFTGQQKVYTFNRNKMLAGDPTAEIAGFSPANLGVGGFAAPIPVHSEGAGAATGDIKIVFYQDDAFGTVATDHIGLWNINMDWTDAATIAASTISDKNEIPTAPFDSTIAGGFANIAQPGTTQRIDAIVGAVMNMSHWYEFGTHQSIVLNWVVEIEDGTQKSGIRWVELRSIDNGANWTLFQEGTFTDPAADTVAEKESVFMGCITMDSDGNIGLGYTKAGVNTFPSLYYTGRFDGDPLGEMTVPEELVIAGTTSVTSNDRYGDYGQGVRDPVDDTTFWVTSEYSGDPGSQRSTRVYSFQLEPVLNFAIICPDSLSVECGDDTSPNATGMAIVTTDCDIAPILTFEDSVQDNCGNTQIITRTWTATNPCDNETFSCTQIITVEDITPPTVMCPADIIAFNDPDQCTAIVIFDVTVSDNCGTTTVTQTSGLPSGSEFPIGVTINTFDVVDECGLNSTCSFIVTVENSEIPEAICQNITIELDENGMATITSADINGGPGTVCVSSNASIDIDTFTCANIGDNNVTLTITDDDGNTDSCVAVVTVEDNIAPIIDCSPFTILLGDDGMATITDAMITNLTTENCAIGIIDISTATFDCSMVGDQLVTVTVTDVNGNVNSCDITVTVADNIAPTAICQNLTLDLDANGFASIEIADIDNGSFDNCGPVTLAIDTTTFNCDDLGVNNVVLTVTDSNGNISTCTANVTIGDNTLPIAICQNLVLELNEEGDPIIITPAMIDNGSSDNCEIISTVLDITEFDCTNIGDNNVVLTVTDSSGNQATCTAVITVNPSSQAPIAACQSITVVLDAQGMASISPQNISANDAFMLCGYVLTLDIDTFTCDDAGTMVPVTLTVTDAQGLSDSCEADVFVIDNLAPTLSCPEDIVIIAATAPYTLPDFSVDDSLITITDNCLGQLTVTQEPPAGTLVEEGETEITITVTDPSGNSISCEFDIFVDPTLDITTSEILSELSVYPNPATNFVRLVNPQSISLEKAQLFDFTGRLVKSFDISNTFTEVTFDISELATASYFLIVEDENTSISFQIIKI